MLVLILITSIGFLFIIREVMMSENYNRIASNFAVKMKYFEVKYPGEWELEKNKLIKGVTVFNNNYKIVDEFKQWINNDILIFLNENCINTTIVDSSGKRVLEVSLPSDIKDEVFKGKVYKGSIKVGQNTYLGAFFPIKNNSGMVLGIWFEGVSKSIINNVLLDKSLFMIIQLVIGIFLALFMSFYVSKILSFHISSFKNYIKTKVLDNDFSTYQEIRIPSVYNEFIEIVEIFNNIIMEHKNLFERVSQTLKIIIDEVKLMGEEAERLMSRAPEQMSSLRNMTNLIEQHSKDINSLFESMYEGNIHSDKSVIKGMAEINRFAEKISADSKMLDSITEIMRVIWDQFNMLYVNASIEATKVGEAGRGFSVVAEEMGKLAEKSLEFSGEVNEVINRMKSDIAEFERNLEKLSDESNKVFAVVVKKVSEKIERISAFIKEVEEVNKENVASARKASEISRKIFTDARELNKSILERI